MAMGWDKYSLAPCCGNLWWIGTDFGGKSGMEGGENSLEYATLIGALFCILGLISCSVYIWRHNLIHV